MTKQEAMERFSSGAVQQSLEIHRGINGPVASSVLWYVR